MEKLSPRYKMHLIEDVGKAIWHEFVTYKTVLQYIDEWHEVEETPFSSEENFSIIYKNNSDDNPNKVIDLSETLHSMEDDLLLKVAIDMGVETPGFIPCVPMFRIDLKQSCETASGTFEKAFKNVESDPAQAISLANSALESIIKSILSDERIKTKRKCDETLYKLTVELLREFNLYPASNIPIEIKTIGSSLLTITQHIEKLRSEKTESHGKSPKGEIIEEPMYAYMCINAVSTVGSFILSYYKKHYPVPSDNGFVEEDDLPF